MGGLFYNWKDNAFVQAQKQWKVNVLEKWVHTHVSWDLTGVMKEASRDRVT